MVAIAPGRNLHLGQVAPGSPFVARTITYGRTGWYRRSDYISISTVLAGEGRLVCAANDREPTIRPLTTGTMFMLRPRDLTSLEGAGAHGFTVAYVAFPISSWRSFAGLAGLDSSWATAALPPSGTVTADDPDGAPAFLRAIERFEASPTIFDLVRFWSSVVPRLLPAAATPASSPPGVPAWLAEALEDMRHDASLRGGVPRLLELCRVTSGHLATVTRRFYGCTPTEMVAELRLRRAADLLRTTPDGIGEIATRCGYSSLVYFSGRFRQAYGISPREYRQSLGIETDIPQLENS
jgi:AraC-like DNA-binding protein